MKNMIKKVQLTFTILVKYAIASYQDCFHANDFFKTSNWEILLLPSFSLLVIDSIYLCH